MKRNETDAYAMILELITIIKLKSESLVSPNMIQEHETYNIKHTQIMNIPDARGMPTSLLMSSMIAN